MPKSNSNGTVAVKKKDPLKRSVGQELKHLFKPESDAYVNAWRARENRKRARGHRRMQRRFASDRKTERKIGRGLRKVKKFFKRGKK